MEDQKGEVEEVKAFKYLGIWLDRGMCAWDCTAGEDERKGRGMVREGRMDKYEG